MIHGFGDGDGSRPNGTARRSRSDETHRRSGNLMSNAIARVLTIAIALLPVASLAEPIKLKLAYFSSDREPAYVSMLQPFVEAVNKQGKGLVEIVPYPGGTLGRSYAQQAQLGRDGGADLAWINPSLTPDLFPDNDVLQFPGLFRDLK